MEIIYGTKNTAKLVSMQICLEGLKREYGLNIVGLSEYGESFPEVEENGESPLDNARAKAWAYYGILKKPVFSLDSGLYFDGLPSGLQPGTDVRRVKGKRLTDAEMTDYYSRLAADNGGRLTGRYINGICLVAGDDFAIEYAGEDIASEKFYLIPQAHEKRVEGFPLDRLSIHIGSGKYYYDLTLDKEEGWNTDKGFIKFFKSAVIALQSLNQNIPT